MTLILTQIAKRGIIFASDTNLTDDQNKPAGTGPKNFAVPYLNAGLSVAGAYTVNGERMDEWMYNFIDNQEQLGVSSLNVFAHTLGLELTSQMLCDEKEGFSLIHIAGYVEDGGLAHPEFWFVRNATGINPVTGKYYCPTKDFCVDEQFWSYYCPKGKLMEAFQQGYSQIFINGMAEGRMSYNILLPYLQSFFNQVWTLPSGMFRPPISIEEEEKIVKAYFRIIFTVFELSYDSTPYVGGIPLTYRIPVPNNVVTESPIFMG